MVMVPEAWQQEKEAETSYLEPQIESIENKLEMAVILKACLQDMLPPTRPHLLSPPN